MEPLDFYFFIFNTDVYLFIYVFMYICRCIFVMRLSSVLYSKNVDNRKSCVLVNCVGCSDPVQALEQEMAASSATALPG